MFANQYLAYESLSPGMQRMLDGNYDETDFALHLMLKDARYAVDMAKTVGVSSDMTAAAAAVFARADAKGLGAKDFSAVAAA